MTQLKMLMLIVFCLPALAGRAHAELILDLKYSDGSTSQTKNVGDTIFLDLSITETAPDTILADEGLFFGRWKNSKIDRERRFWCSDRNGR